MRNNLIFNGKRELIPNVINRALAEYKEWIEAQRKDNGEQEHYSRANEKPYKPKSVLHSLFCFVDSSWLSEKERAGIGWKLVNETGLGIMIGSCSTDPIATALEAEAYALREAARQVRHGYNNVAFCLDSEIIHAALEKCLRGDIRGKNQHIYGYVEDIRRLVADLYFKFYVVPRQVVEVVDALAKQARISCSGYVIKWGYS